MARRTAAEPKQRKVALAFAGLGDSTIENTTDLLDDFLGVQDDEFPEDDVLDLRLVLPASKAYLSKGFKSVLEWSDGYELAYDAIEDMTEPPSNAVLDVTKYAENVSQSKNLPKAIIDALVDAKDEGYETYLVLLWGEEGDENSEILLDLASSFDIKALDLTAGLDDLAFDNEDEEEPEAEAEPEPAPEPEKPAPRARRSRKTEEPVPKDVADAEAAAAGDPPWDTEDKPVAETPKPAARRSRTKKAEEVPPTPEDQETLQETLARVRDSEPDEAQELAGRALSSDFLAPTSKDMVRTWTTWAEKYLPESRERALVITKIQEAALWAYAAEAQFFAEPVAETPQEASSAPQEDEEAPKRGRGRPRTRTASDRAVTEWFDEEENAWVRAGRGRIPKDVKTRKVDPDSGDVIE